MKYDSENQTMKKIQIAVSSIGARLWRNNSALGWCGKATKITKPTTCTLYPGTVVIQDARPLHAGLCKGSSDLIGFRVVFITPDMVGQRVAQFIACEVKSETGSPTKEQIGFLNLVHQAGGQALLAKSPETVLNALTSEELQNENT